MYPTLYITWNPNPELCNLFGFSIRYYGLLWALALIFGYYIVHYQFKEKKIPEKTFEPLFFYTFFGILIGSRLGHCLFYAPGYYLNHFWEMILPIKEMPNGSWKFIGYEGMASHGGVIGLLISLGIYCYKKKIHFIELIDMYAMTAPELACCIRLANLINSEIIGKPCELPWAFIFVRVDPLPRHPGQLYEALAYFVLMFVMYYLYKKYRSKLHRGFLTGFCMTWVFVARFLIEFVKENQEAFENGMTLNMGQWLSIPFIFIGIYFMCFYNRGKTRKTV